MRHLMALCVVLAFAASSPAFSAPPESLVWVTPESGANLLSVKACVEQSGGSVVSLAPEGRLLVRIPSGAEAQLSRIKGVIGTEALAMATPAKSAPVNPKRLGERPPTPEEQAYIKRAYSKVDSVAPNALSRQRALLSGQPGLPATVDNSLSQYFPPIGDQGGQGSCTCFASCYYYNTYTQARDEGLNVSSGNTDYISSPAFMYALINGGDDAGGYTPEVMARLNDVGCSSWTLMPYSDSDYTTWPSEAGWVDALKRRNLASHVIGSDAGCTDADLLAIKQHLANGNIAATHFLIYDNLYDSYPNDGAGINNGVLFANGGFILGGHAVTLVGYDDNKSYNDGTTTQHGAFLIANSWGSWGVTNTIGSKDGFFWVAYSFFKSTPDCFGIAFFNDDRPHYRPQLYAATGLENAQRGSIAYMGGVGVPGAAPWTSYAPIDHAGGIALSIAGTKRVVVDLTDGIPRIAGSGTIQLFVGMSVDSDASSGSISIADFSRISTGTAFLIQLRQPIRP